MRRAGLTVAGALLVFAVGCTTTRTVYVPAKASSSATTGNVSPDSGYPTAPDTYSPPAQSTTQTLNSTCVVDGTDANDESSYGWTLTFTNPSSTDITVGGYTVVFFGTDGSETGSQTAANTPFTVAAGQSYADTEDHSMIAAVPSGSATCRLSTWDAG